MLSGAILLTQVSCSPYSQVTLPGEDIRSNKQLREDFSEYDVYIHDRTSTYKLNDPALKGNQVQGKPDLILSAEEVQEITSPKTRKELKAHRYDLNIYTLKDISGYTASNDSSLVLHQDHFALDMKDIDKLGAYEVNRKKAIAGAIAVVAVVVVAVLAIVVVAAAVNGSANGGSDSGNSGSGNSDSGSGSGSDSGSGGSGGSGSDSGSN